MTKQIAVLGALAALVLAGCSSTPSTSEESAASVVTSGGVTLNAAVVMDRLEGMPEEEKESFWFEFFDDSIPGVPDSKKREMTTSVCKLFDDGGSWSDLEQVIYSAWGADNSPSIQLVTAVGVLTYCPEYVSLLPENY